MHRHTHTHTHSWTCKSFFVLAISLKITKSQNAVLPRQFFTCCMATAANKSSDSNFRFVLFFCCLVAALPQCPAHFKQPSRRLTCCERCLNAVFKRVTNRPQETWCHVGIAVAQLRHEVAVRRWELWARTKGTAAVSKSCVFLLALFPSFPLLKVPPLWM